MQLFLLSSRGHGFTYETLNEIVVAATSEEEARRIAAGSAGREGVEHWLHGSPAGASCEVIGEYTGEEKEPFSVCIDYEEA